MIAIVAAYKIYSFEWRDDDFQIPRFEASINWGMKCPKVLLPITDEASVK
jgi:hypothetical protein